MPPQLRRAQPWSRLFPLAFAVMALAVFLLPLASGAQSSSSLPGDVGLREHGRQVFADKCGTCHDADAAKKLPDGSTLLERLAARQDPQVKLATRLKSMSEQDARGVSLYMEGLIEQFRVAKKTSGQK